MADITVNVKFVAAELTPGLTGGDYAISSGTTVRDLLALCEEKCGAAIPAENYKYMYPLFRGKPVKLSTKLETDGTLHMCRIVMGG